MAAVANSSIRINSGEQVILPYSAVSRIIIENPEVARASFQPDGTAIIEGVGRGETTAEIYQSDGTPKLIAIQVGDATPDQKSPPLRDSHQSPNSGRPGARVARVCCFARAAARCPELARRADKHGTDKRGADKRGDERVSHRAPRARNWA